MDQCRWGWAVFRCADNERETCAPSCFQRWKKSSDIISVGWKNLLSITGSFTAMFWRAPPYLFTRGGRRCHKTTYRGPLKKWVFRHWLELDVEHWCLCEIRQTFHVEDLLDLSSSFYQGVHRLGVDIELWTPRLRILLKTKWNALMCLWMYWC